MRRLVCAFVSRKAPKTGFLASSPCDCGLSYSFVHVSLLSSILTRGPMGPESLTWILVRRRGCLLQNIISILQHLSPSWVSLRSKPKPVKSVSSIKSYLYAPFNVWPIYPTERAGSVHNVKHFKPQSSSEKKMFYFLSQYRSQGCVKGQNIYMHGVICFILINLIMQHDYFQKSKEINLLIPPQGSRVSVRAKYLLIRYCKLHSL